MLVADDNSTTLIIFQVGYTYEAFKAYKTQKNVNNANQRDMKDYLMIFLVDDVGKKTKFIYLIWS